MSLFKANFSVSGTDRQFQVGVSNLIIAGWTGRNPQAIAAHIEELAAIGVPRPKSTPIFYRGGASLLTQETEIQVVGDNSSGEAEPIVVSAQDTQWLSVGSDHTDRKLETMGITVAKQLCPKPIATEVWRLDAVADHWDQLILRSWSTRNGVRRLYQEDVLASMHRPADLLARYSGPGFALPEGWVMFCGTVATRGAIEPADCLELEIEDPVLRRRIRHVYHTKTLPIEG